MSCLILNEIWNIEEVKDDSKENKMIKFEKEDAQSIEMIVEKNTKRSSVGTVLFVGNINDKFMYPDKSKNELYSIRKKLTKWVEDSYGSYLRVLLIDEKENTIVREVKDYTLTIFEEAFILDFAESSNIYGKGEYSISIRQKENSNMGIVKVSNKDLEMMNDEQFRKGTNLIKITVGEVKALLGI